MANIDITIHNTFLPHDDPEESLAFYRDTLVSRSASTSAPARCAGSPSAAQPARHLDRAAPTGRRPRHHRRGAAHHRRDDGQGTYAIIVLATSDLDATFERLQGTDADIVQEPTEQPYGVRDFAVRDPAGTMVRIQEVR